MTSGTLFLGLPKDQVIAWYFAIYLVVILLHMFSKKFRDTSTDWLTFKDPLGWRFLTKNWGFSIFSLLYFGFGAVLVSILERN